MKSENLPRSGCTITTTWRKFRRGRHLQQEPLFLFLSRLHFSSAEFLPEYGRRDRTTIRRGKNKSDNALQDLHELKRAKPISEITRLVAPCTTRTGLVDHPHGSPKNGMKSRVHGLQPFGSCLGTGPKLQPLRPAGIDPEMVYPMSLETMKAPFQGRRPMFIATTCLSLYSHIGPYAKTTTHEHQNWKSIKVQAGRLQNPRKA